MADNPRPDRGSPEPEMCPYCGKTDTEEACGYYFCRICKKWWKVE